MTGQVDVGFSAIPFFLDRVEDDKIRIIATGNQVVAFKTRSGRVNLTNLNTLQNRKDALMRFHRAYKETVEWMYSDPAALKHFSDYSGLPEKVVVKVRELMPKETMAPDRVVGIDQIIAEAVSMKFLADPPHCRAGQGTDPDSGRELIRAGTNGSGHQPGSGLAAIYCAGASSFAIALTTRASIGSTLVGKTAATWPSRPMRYLWKFQRGVSSGRSVAAHL